MDVVVTPYRDGPLLVRGPIRMQDQDGEEIVTDREIVALCRCGKSRTRPLCDGTHKLIRFRAPSGLEAMPAPRPAPPRGSSSPRAKSAANGRPSGPRG